MKSTDKPAGPFGTESSMPSKGYLYVMAAALLWACSGTAGKYLFLQGLLPAELVQARVTIAALLLLVLLAAFKRPLLKIRPAELSGFLVLGLVVTPLLQMTYFLAIKHIPVALALLIQYLAPILVALFSLLFLRESLTWAKSAALVLSLAGCYLALGGLRLSSAGLNGRGVFWGLCSAFLYAGYTLLSERQMRRFSPWTVLFYALLLAGLSLNVALGPLIFLGQGHTSKEWLLIGFVAVFGTLIPFGLFYLGINQIRSTHAIITATLEPIFAAILAFVLIAEKLAPLQILGGTLVIGAIVLLQLERGKGELAPAAIRARRREHESKNTLIGTPE